MYVRQAKQFMRNVDPTFDERKYGFGTLQDLLRACQRDGLFRIERDRQGVIRLFPGNIMQPSTGADDPEEDAAARRHRGAGWRERPGVGARRGAGGRGGSGRPIAGPPIASRTARNRRTEVVDGDVVQEMEVQQVVDGEEATCRPSEPKRGRGTRKRAAQPRAAKKTEGAAPRARKTADISASAAARKPPSES